MSKKSNVMSGICALVMMMSVAAPITSSAIETDSDNTVLSISDIAEDSKLDKINFTLVTKKKGTAVLKWKKVKGATGYIISYKSKKGEDWVRLAKVDADVRTYTVKKLSGNYHGYVGIRAIKKEGKTTYIGKRNKQKIYKYPYAAKYLDKKGWKLKKAFMASVIPHKNPNNVLPTDADTTMEFYAKYGFTHGHGHCYVMAAMFTEMARTLGYDATQVWGYVKTANSGHAIHSWTEIRKNGKTYVCDSSFQGHYPKSNGFMFEYGTKGTWVYTKEGNVATNDDE